MLGIIFRGKLQASSTPPPSLFGRQGAGLDRTLLGQPGESIALVGIHSGNCVLQDDCTTVGLNLRLQPPDRCELPRKTESASLRAWGWRPVGRWGKTRQFMCNSTSALVHAKGRAISSGTTLSAAPPPLHIGPWSKVGHNTGAGDLPRSAPRLRTARFSGSVVPEGRDQSRWQSITTAPPDLPYLG